MDCFASRGVGVYTFVGYGLGLEVIELHEIPRGQIFVQESSSEFDTD